MTQKGAKQQQKGKARLRALATPVTWGVVAALSSVSQHAAAAEEDNTTSGGLEEIIVTATKRAENLQDVSLTVTALSADALQTLGIQEAEQIALATPGMVFNNVSSLAKIYIRGIGTRATSNGLENSVATYVDERYVARPTGGLFDLLDVDRVEVLKGPQGTLYGRNATGGAIRIITKEVSDQLEGSVEAGAGNYHAWDVKGVLNVPLGDKFGVRIAAMSDKRDGYMTNLSPVGIHDWNDKNKQAMRAKMRWEITDQVVSRLTVNYWTKDDLDGVNSVCRDPLNLCPSVNLGGMTGDLHHVNSQLSKKNKGHELSTELRFDVGFDAFDFQSITTTSLLNVDSFFDADSTNRIDQDVYSFERAKDYGQEFRVLSHKGSRWTWLAGAYAYNGKTAYDSPFQQGPLTVSPGLQTVKVYTYAGFGEVGYAFSDHWSLKVGSRYSSDRKDLTVEKSPAARVTVAPVAGNPYKDSNTWGRATSNITLEYRADFGLVYAKFAQGYKDGGYNYPAIFTGGSIRPVLEPEKLNSYEVGYKGDLFNKRLRFNTSVFYYDFKDLQVNFAQTASIVPSVFSENAAAAKVKGAETELTWIPVDLLNVRTGVSYTDGYYSDYKNAATNFPNATNTGWVAGNFDATGKPLNSTPKWTAFLGLGYPVRIGEASLPLSINYSWKAHYDEEFVIIPQQHNLRQGGYGLLGARIGFVPSANSKWEASVWGENLTDRIYNLVAIQNNVSFAPPRTYGVDVKYSF